MRKRLVFRVDDVGYTPAYDMGAFKAFECGIASSADVMFDSPDTVAALTWLKDKRGCQSAGIGICGKVRICPRRKSLH